MPTNRGLAERVGFEPTVPTRGTTVFETVPFDHSGTSPSKRHQALSTGRQRTKQGDWHRIGTAPIT